jgi:hypothetical protein
VTLTAEAPVSFRGGRLYLSADACARHFPGSQSVALLRRDGDLLVLPVRQAAAGGYILKQRNGAGDRVVDAPDFFRGEGVADTLVWCEAADWSEADAALALLNFFVHK